MLLPVIKFGKVHCQEKEEEEEETEDEEEEEEEERSFYQNIHFYRGRQGDVRGACCDNSKAP